MKRFKHVKKLNKKIKIKVAEQFKTIRQFSFITPVKVNKHKIKNRCLFVKNLCLSVYKPILIHKKFFAYQFTNIYL